jgi:L,D-peptidoglycan transpeptidase YkuD (ErfK/YbiS/YcfS/YnhG family)
MKLPLLPLFLLVVSLATPARGQDRPPSPCLPGETGVVVVVRDHQLALCERGRFVARYPVALGSGGVGKRRQGDAKTPLGVYPLGTPRASQSFGTFVPVGYPTPAQKKLGYTGFAVGIHGPPRGSTVTSPLNTAFDWTLGCIAVGSDAEMDAISAWLRRQRTAGVRIH